MSERPWSGRRLHFVGIGGAGMSGLAIVARALGAEVTGSDRAPDSPYLARTGLTAVPHDAANVPEGAEVVYSSAIPPENPERAAARERGLRELHRADLLGEITRLRPTIAVTGTHGKTTTSSMVVHALRGCGLDPVVPGRRRGALDRLQRGLGGGGVARGRGRRVRPLAAQARPADRGAHQRRARPPRDLLVAARRRRHLPRLPGAGRRGRARRRARADPLPGPRRAAGGGRARARRLALQRRRRARLAAGPGRPQRPQRGGRARRLRARGRRPRGGRRRAGRLRRRRPAVRAAGDDGRGRAGGRRLRAPPDRGARHDRRRPHARAAPRGGRLPAAPVLAHAPPVPRVRRRAGRGRRSSRCSTSTRRASAPRTSRA